MMTEMRVTTEAAARLDGRPLPLEPNETNQHGGRRPHAGRKPVLAAGRNSTFRLTPEHLAMIDAWGRKHGIDQRSAALRHLIEQAQ